MERSITQAQDILQTLSEKLPAMVVLILCIGLILVGCVEFIHKAYKIRPRLTAPLFTAGLWAAMWLLPGQAVIALVAALSGFAVGVLANDTFKNVNSYIDKLLNKKLET